MFVVIGMWGTPHPVLSFSATKVVPWVPLAPSTVWHVVHVGHGHRAMSWCMCDALVYVGHVYRVMHVYRDVRRTGLRVGEA